MPNWCQNVIYVSHKDEKKMAALKDAIIKGELCDHIKPMPDALKGITSGACTIGDVQCNLWREDENGNNVAIPQAELDQMTADHGTASWYDWACKNWGTKWDICSPWDTDEIYNDEDGNGTYVFKFDTAWSPPIPIYDAMIDQGFNLVARYVEYGCGYHGEYGVDGDYYHDSIEDGDEIDEHLQSEYA
jgi:hypothetical protein